MAKSMEFCDYAEADSVAAKVADMFKEFETRRSGFKAIAEEARQYIFATDTRSTSASKLPWKNSVHIPKLCQIRDNLHSNYMAALFPNDKAISWEGDDETSQTKQKRRTIKAYIQNKLRMSKFATELSKCVLDYIDYGNCFATVEYVVEKQKDAVTGQEITGFVGPRMVRISPLDIVFDPTASRFEDSPKIVRSIKTLGDLKLEIENNPEKGYLEEVFTKLINLRSKFSSANQGDVSKNSQFVVDGFTSFLDYFKSDYVEILDFYGDIYDADKQTLLRNQVITVVDRCYVIRQNQLNNWTGKAPFFHAGWRLRPDNLYAMGPLDNLIGMQYRIDHLENSKADGLDMILHPVLKIKGAVEAFKYGPGERIYTSEEGDVEFMHPDASILQIDTQIAIYEQKMEEMAGAPKQAMGFRTPGEKTAYEVQILDNAANKVFINKTSYLEEIFVEPVLNSMLEQARRNLSGAETIRIEDEDFNFDEFLTVTREDITAIGKIRPIGARRFARNANLLQNLTQMSATQLYADPSINTHFSGKKMARLLEELLGLEDYKLVEDNVRVVESVETQQMQSDGQQLLMEKGATPNSVPGAPPGPQGSAAAPPVQGMMG